MGLGGRSWWVAGGCALAVALLAPASAQAAPEELGKRFVPGEVIVGFKQATEPQQRIRARRAVDAELDRRLLLPRTQLLDLDRGESVRGAIDRLEARGAVRYAEPNGIVRASQTIPNDFQFEFLWGLNNEAQEIPTDDVTGTLDADIDAPEAWDLQTGEGAPNGPVVAVVDSGVTHDHLDFAGNIWANPEESGNETDDVDNGPNGFVDDHVGWDFVDGDNDPVDLNGHGTHVAGTVGARGNNGFALTGVNWETQLMPLRALGVDGVGTFAGVADAFTYAGDNGADIVNASLGGMADAGQVTTLTNAINGAPDTLFVFAAGNDDTDNDTTPHYPCNIDVANVICVAATDENDELASFSNFGAESVDLAAPGALIWSLWPRASLFFDNFATDIGTTGWVTGGANDTWANTTEDGPFDPPHTSLTDSEGTDYQPDTDSFARSPEIDLSGRTGCALNFFAKLELGADDPDDFIAVEASTDNATWDELDRLSGQVDPREFGYDLADYDGASEFYFRFRLDSDSDATVDNGGWFDSVSVTCTALDLLVRLNGTSMATPHVAGVAALALSEIPSASVDDLRDAILGGVDPKPDLSGDVATGGRLNALDTLELLTPDPPQPPPAPPPPPTPPAPPSNGAPELDLSGKKQQRAGKKLKVKVECDEPCTVRGKGKLKVGGKSFKLKVKPRKLALGAGDRGKLKLKLSRRARRAAKNALKDDKNARANVKVTATDASGLTDKAKRKIKLK